jgi:rhomboid protease GluP
VSRFRRATGAILCPSCGRLTEASADACYFCGRRHPGTWVGLTGWLRQLWVSADITRTIMIVCGVLYVVSLLIDPREAMRMRGPFEVLSPTLRALNDLGMTGALAWHLGQWWTLITAIYLHGGLLHILFNILWVRQLGPEVETVYGRARLVVIFTAGGVAGFLLSDFVGVPFTIGASGSIFGLLGALVAYGRQRGGTFGAMVFRRYGQWALILFVMGFLLSGVNNFAHAGGFVGGLLVGLCLSSTEHRPETGLDYGLAAGAVLLTLIAFGLALSHGLARSLLAWPA